MPDDEVVGLDVDGLAGLDDPPARATEIAILQRGEAGQQGGPAAQIAPPTSIAPITTRWSAAAPSMTAWSMEIGVIRS